MEWRVVADGPAATTFESTLGTLRLCTTASRVGDREYWSWVVIDQQGYYLAEGHATGAEDAAYLSTRAALSLSWT